MKFIDTHCHLYLEDFKSDIDTVMKRAREAGVKQFYLPAIDSNVLNDILTFENKYPGECFAMAGLHPTSVKENYMDELRVVEQQLKKRKFAAVGEIGLDFYWDTTFTQQQYEAFEIQMQWALQHNMPVVIHTRNAMQQTINAVKPFAQKGLKGIFHCFGDKYEKALQIIDMNFYLGIGGVLTYKNSGLDSVISKIDLKHVILETDAPYLTPVPFRGKRNESSYIRYVAEKLASVKNVPVEEIAEITTANAEKIFI